MSRKKDIEKIKKHGFKAFKPDRHSYQDEDGQHWMQCKFCCEYQKVDEGIGYITCGGCVTKIDIIQFPDTAIKKQKVSSGRPPGWHFMNEFVDKDGNVFHKGKEQPDLKGTLPPTKVKPPKKRKKLSKDQKLYKRIDDWKKRKKLRKQTKGKKKK